VVEIHHNMAHTFPGKDIMIGEVGWPSAGRMREGARPSPSNQALVLHEVVAIAKREGFKVNLIEAFDQPWKRALEGTVGGRWGLFDSSQRQPKFTWGEPVSDHPYWPWQAALGIAFAGIVMAAGVAPARSFAHVPHRVYWLTGFSAAIAGSMIGWTLEILLAGALGFAGAVQGLLLMSIAAAAPLSAAALTCKRSLPDFSDVLNRKACTALNDRLAIATGLVLVLTTLIAMQSAIALAVDPRYREFPFPALTGAVVPLALVALWCPPVGSTSGRSEVVAASLLLITAGVVLVQESVANWQAAWFCGAIVTLALILVRARLVRVTAPGWREPWR
jgi:glucan 1,3-beta-glucosidase